MSRVEVTYSGDRHCTALDTKNGKRVAADCAMSKGEEFGPEGLVAAGLASCMLISMASFAERHGLDVAGARAEVDTAFGGKPDMHIAALDITVRVPGSFTKEQQAGLEKAAEACPIKHSFRADTKISTRFVFGDASIAAP